MNTLSNQTLIIIPARGGSKGIPGKNIKPLGGKALILWTTDLARRMAEEINICVSTDAEAIKNVVEQSGLPVPFLRPAALASDTAGTYEVLLHALEYYAQKGKTYDRVLLLQPTSPFRTTDQIAEALRLYTDDVEMVVSVRESADNPYYNLFEEDEKGFLRKSKEGMYTRRQDCPPVYALNGAIYVINTHALIERPMSQFTRIKRVEMDELSSLDLDTPIDWNWAEYLLRAGSIELRKTDY